VELATRAAKGDISQEWQRRISTVIVAVRADLSIARLTAPAADVKTAGVQPYEATAPAATAHEPEAEAPQEPGEAPVVSDLSPPWQR